jgi:hypothetical protein
MSDSENLPPKVDTPSPKLSDEQSTPTSEAERLFRIVAAHRTGKRFWVRVLLVHDKHYPWSLHECAVMTRDGLRELGYTAYFTEERKDPCAGWPTPEERAERARGEQQIIIGGNIATPTTALSIPDDAIIYNFEQVGGWQFAPPYVKLLQRCVVWEYHPANIDRLGTHHGIAATLVPFGYVPAFTPPVHTYMPPDFDVAFIGSLVPYRTKVINDLKLAGLRVHASDSCYEDQRADILRRSKLVVNVHFYPQVKLLEVVRLGLVMAQCKAVVTQLDGDTRIDPYYLPGVCGAKYDEIVPAVVDLVRNDRKREELAYTGYKLFAARLATDSLQKGLAAYAPRQPASLPQSYERAPNASGVTYRRISRDGKVR